MSREQDPRIAGEVAEQGVSERDVAIIGLSCRFPGAPDAAAYWRMLESGTEAVRELSDEELLAAGVPRRDLVRPDYVKAASWIDGVEEFDADFFGYTPREAEILDPQQRLFLEHAWWALEDAGVEPARFDGLIGVYAGVAWNTYLLSNLMSHRGLFDGGGAFQVFITNDKDFLPTRASYKLDLKGPSMSVQTSCSTSLVASHLACLSLQNYECDLALVGGVTVKVPQRAGYFYLEGGLASPDGHCRSFDAEAAGTVFGSGIGVVVLKRLAEALEDGDPIRAVIRGSAINNDGSVKVSYTAPSVEGQAEVIAAAQELAGVDAETIRYVECHGTGTSLGDPIEVRALSKVFRASTDKRGYCALGSVKSNVGHLDAAAGVAGLIKTTLALQARRIPPTVNFQTPNPALDLEASPFYIAAKAEDWSPISDTGRPAGTGTVAPRRAGVSSFGVGGTNAHLILQEAPPPLVVEDAVPARRRQLILLSARSAEALETACLNLREDLQAQAETARAEEGAAELAGELVAELADVAYTLHTGRRTFSHRRAIVTENAEQLVQQLRPATEGGGGTGVLSAVDPDEPRPRPVAFLFSGQGSVYPGLLQDLLDDDDPGNPGAAGAEALRVALDACAEILHGEPDLLRLLDLATPASELERTLHAQPLLFAVEYALARQWQAWGVEPVAFLGHSVGEYVAACLAGVMELEDALTLVAARGRLMDALPAGGMLAVPLPEAETLELVERLRRQGHVELALAAVNEPGRCVVAGPDEAIAAFQAELAVLDASPDASSNGSLEGRPLHTSHAFHSPMMEPACEPLRQVLAGISLQPPEIPFVSNLTGTWITDEEATDPDYWLRHLRQPVRFADGVATLLEDPARVLLEVGPGSALATLAGRHSARTPRQPVLHSLPHPRQVEQGVDALSVLLEAYGGLWLAGLDLDGELLYDGQARRRRSLPGYPFQRQRYWIESQWDVIGGGSSDAVSSMASFATSSKASSKTGGGALRQQPDVQDWFYLPSWRPGRLASGERGSLPTTWLLAFDDQPLLPVAQLEEGLQALGATVSERASGQSWVDALKDTLQAVDEEASLGVLLASLSPDELVTLAAALSDVTADGERQVAVELWVLTQGAVLLPGARPRATPSEETADSSVDFEVAALSGLLRVLPQEQPAVRCRLLDIEAGVTARQVLAELQAEVQGHGDAERIALRPGERWVEAFEAAPLPLVPEASQRSDARDVLLVGALSGEAIGAARVLADSLPEGGRLWLLLPTGGAADQAQRRIEAQRRRITELAARLSERGGSVEPREVELGDSAAVEAVLREAASFDDFAGFATVLLAPLAGFSGDQPELRTLADLGTAASSDQGLQDSLRPILDVAQALDSAFSRWVDSSDSPTEAWLLTSLASLLGGLAFGERAAAAAALEAFALARRRGGSVLSWHSAALDVWQVDAATTSGAPLNELAMTPAQGEDVLHRLLVHGASSGDWLVSTGDLAARRAQRRRAIDDHRALVLGTGTGMGNQDGTGAGRHPRPDLPTPYATPSSDLERRIVEVWSQFLGFEQIGADDNFFELGGDSFIAVQVTTRLRQVLGADLPVARLYQGVTPRALARLLESEEEQQEQRQERLEEKREVARDRRALLEQRRRAKKR